MGVVTEEILLHSAGESVGVKFGYDVLSSGGRFHRAENPLYAALPEEFIGRLGCDSEH